MVTDNNLADTDKKVSFSRIILLLKQVLWKHFKVYFISFQICLLNLLSSSLCCYFYICECVCVSFRVYLSMYYIHVCIYVCMYLCMYYVCIFMYAADEDFVICQNA